MSPPLLLSVKLLFGAKETESAFMRQSPSLHNMYYQTQRVTSYFAVLSAAAAGGGLVGLRAGCVRYNSPMRRWRWGRVRLPLIH
jgi:hypothetical protein